MNTIKSSQKKHILEKENYNMRKNSICQKTIKGVLSIFLVLSLICSIFTVSVSAVTYSTGTYQVNTSSGVNVRSGPASNYSRVGAATNGTTFTVSTTSASWGYTSSIKCTNGTRSGWVCLDYCVKQGSSKIYCTMTYNANGGYNAPSSVTVEKGKIFYISKTIPVRQGYSFLGWGSKNASTATISPGHDVYMNRDCTAYAVWAKGSPKKGYSTPLNNGHCYYISPACATNSFLDVTDWGKTNDTNIQIWEKGYTKNQRWQAKYYGSGYYYFVDYNSKRVLDVHGGYALNCNNVSIWDKNLSDAQLFRLINAGDGYYYIQSKINSSYYLDVNKGSSSNGTNVHLYQSNNSVAQKFKFIPVFDVSAAVKYAQKYTDNSGDLYRGTYNTSYNIYNSDNIFYSGYDCANFLSQCLYAGGLNATNEWAPVYRGQNYRKISGGSAWVNADDLYTYLRKQGFHYAKVNKSLTNIYRGDVVFMDLDNDGDADHSTICTGFINNSPVFCAHSNWRKNAYYSTSQWSGGTAYVVHMSGYGT